MKELRFDLQTKQRSFLDAIEKFPIVFFGGARGGGKSKAIQLIMLLRRFKYPGTTGVIFRRTYPELEANHIRPMFQSYPDLRQFYNESKKLITFPNGSTLQFSHCNSGADISLYQGREIEDLAIDEVGQWEEGMFRTLMTSNRTSKPGIKAKCFIAGNPGGIGHQWLKRIFIDRRFNERERPDDYAFIKSLVYDNPALIENDPEYVYRLKAEPNEALRKAWLEGDWDLCAGQYFGEIRREVHFIKWFDIPSHWTRFGSYDFGFNHPAAFGWFACDEDGNVYLYRELAKAQLRVDQFAEVVNRYADTKELSTIAAGWDCWQKKSVLKQGSAPTIAEEFLEHGLILSRAKIDRIQGASQVRSYLAWQNLSNGRSKPRFYILDSCPISFDCLSRMLVDPDRPEDVLKVDAVDGDPLTGDDCYDMVRMALMTRPTLAEPAKVNHKYGSHEWAKHQSKKLEDEIDKQIEKQQAAEREKDFFETSGMDDGETMSYFVRKKAR